MADCFVVLDHLLGQFVDCIIKLLFYMNFLAYCGYIFIDVVMIPRPWPRVLPTFKAWLLSTRSFCFKIEGISTLWWNHKPCWFIAIERYWNFKLYRVTFFSKICASKFGVRLIYGCGLYMDIYGIYFHISLCATLNETFSTTFDGAKDTLSENKVRNLPPSTRSEATSIPAPFICEYSSPQGLFWILAIL